MNEEIYNRLSSLNYELLFNNFRQYNYILIDKDTMYINNIKTQYNENIKENSVYCIDKKLYAVWNMNLNDKNWTFDDIIAGIIHEMFHCFQIENNFFVEYSDIVFRDDILDSLILNVTNPNWTNDLSTIYKNIDENYIQDIKSIEKIEGTALWVELNYKRIYCNLNFNTAMKDYLRYIISSKKKHLIHYYIGCYIYQITNNIGNY